MGKKEKKGVVGIEKRPKEKRTFRTEVETYLLFGLIVLFIGILVGTTASAIAIYKNANPDLESSKMIEECEPVEETEVNAAELDLNEIKEIAAPEE